MEEHIRGVIGLLNEQAEYAVLRNWELLPTDNASRDIDIIITRRSYRKAIPQIVSLIEQTDWKIVTYLHSDRLLTLVCGRQEEGRTDLVQWDFFVDTSVFGIRLMGAEEFLEHRQWSGFLYYVDVPERFLDKYLYNRAVGSKYPDKYADTRAQAEHSPRVEAKLQSIFGVKTVAEADKMSGRKLLLRAIGRNLRRRPVGTVVGVCRFLRTFIGNYISSRTGFSIGFTGPDGSGKTTVIDGMLERLGPVFRTAHAYYHFRPALFGNLGEVAHKAGLKKEVDRNYSDPHRGGRTGALGSLARLMYYSTDYVAGYFLRVKTLTRITRLVIFDRYYTDIICDSRRSRIYLPYKFLRAWGRLFIPTLDYNVLLTAPTEVILSRKAELDADGIRDINRRIDYLAPKKGYLKVVNDSTPDAAIDAILTEIFENQHRKNLKRLPR